MLEGADGDVGQAGQVEVVEGHGEYRNSRVCGPHWMEIREDARLSVVVVVGLRAYGARLSDRGAAATDSEVN